MTEAANFWGMSIADWVSLAPAAIAIYAVFSAWRAQPAWLMLRRRHAAMKKLGIGRSASKERVRQIIQGAPNAASDELNWLAAGYPVRVGGVARGQGNPMPLTFAVSATELVGLSEAYSRYAADLGRGSFLGTTSVPVIERETAMAAKTSRVLAEAAAGGGHGGERPSRHLRIESQALARELDFWQLPDAASGTLAYDTFVSYRRHRYSPDFHDRRSTTAGLPAALESPGMEAAPMNASDAEKLLLRNKLDSQHAFDGVLPRLVGWRTERDNGNGRLRLHLAMAETTYGAVLLDHYPDALGSEVRDVTGARAKLLTLSALVVTSDRKLLFAGRSRHAGSHPDQFGPAVNGNLELRPRKGILSDSDEYGLPDPRRALAREASEELGLVMDPHRIQILGMGRFSVGEKERGTHVLLTLAQPDLTAVEITAGIRDADPMEGRWELGGEFLAAPLPRPGEDIDPILSWLLHDRRLTPHAVLTGIATVARFFPVTPGQLQRLTAAPQDPGFAAESLQLDY